MNKILELLKEEEGFRAKAYYCSERYPTIGFGTKLGPRDAPLGYYTFSVTENSAEQLLIDRVDSIMTSLQGKTFFDCANDARRAVFVSMAYQMGVTGLLKFKNMIDALERDDFKLAAKHALDSLWARQTPERAAHHALVIESGHLSW